MRDSGTSIKCGSGCVVLFAAPAKSLANTVNAVARMLCRVQNRAQFCPHRVAGYPEGPDILV